MPFTILHAMTQKIADELVHLLCEDGIPFSPSTVEALVGAVIDESVDSVDEMLDAPGLIATISISWQHEDGGSTTETIELFAEHGLLYAARPKE